VRLRDWPCFGTTGARRTQLAEYAMLFRPLPDSDTYDKLMNQVVHASKREFLVVLRPAA
jgi:hypothetical protein